MRHRLYCALQKNNSGYFEAENLKCDCTARGPSECLSNSTEFRNNFSWCKSTECFRPKPDSRTLYCRRTNLVEAISRTTVLEFQPMDASGLQVDGGNLQDAWQLLTNDIEDELFKFLSIDCQPVMPKWILNVQHNLAHEAIGSHTDVIHRGDIDCGAYSDVYLVSFAKRYTGSNVDNRCLVSHLVRYDHPRKIHPGHLNCRFSPEKSSNENCHAVCARPTNMNREMT